MKLTLSWLKSHLDTDADLETIVRTLTMQGLEVDEVVDRGKDLAPFRVAHVLTAEPHPNADKLRVCRVDTGAETLQVVCGAPNARAGLKVVFAPTGSTIPRNGMVLKEATIRGVASSGMLCSAFEMALSDDHEGIMELPQDAPVGAPFASVLGLDDPLLDVKITANRADCLGVRGIARDLAAAGLGTLKPLSAPPIPGVFASAIGVSIADTKACPIFIGRWIRGVKNGPSPQWLSDRLLSIGLRPISALVDITNFTTFDLDRPLHVFDAAKIKGSLRIHPAAGGETLAALNAKEYTLAGGETVISDDTGVISLGGVIGGESTGCDFDTTDVFLEVALFDPVRTAATGRALNLQSDARYRFERGLDPAFVFEAAEIATRLILGICGGEASELVVAGAVPDWQRTITLRPSRVASLGGVDVPEDEIRRILTTLGCTIEASGQALSVSIPSWRGDIEGEADLVEEVLRIYGYDHIPATPLPPVSALPRPALDAGQRRSATVRRALVQRGLDEAVTFSFAASSLLEAEGGAIFGGVKPELRLVNPISADLDVMRPSILPNLLSAAKRNADRGFGDVALVEIGPQYAGDGADDQSLVAAGIRVGRTAKKLWSDPGRPVDVFLAKADALAALAAAGAPVDTLQVTADPPGWYHPGRGGAIRLGPKSVLAHFGEIHPRLMRVLDLKGPAVGFEVYLDTIPFAKSAKAKGAFRPSALQPVERDFAFILDETVTAEQLLRAAKGADRKLISDIRLFDVYTGPGVPEGKKSLAFTVTLQPVEATLTDEVLEQFSKALVANVGKQTGGVLRG